MLPGDFPLTLYRGDTGRWKFMLWDDEEKTDPTDLIGATAAAQIRDKPGGTTIIDLGCTITEPNIIDVLLSDEMSKLLPAKGVWDLQITYSFGDVSTIVAGKVTVTADVTDSTVTARRLRAVP